MRKPRNLETVHEMKDLGVTIDEKLSFKSYIQDKIKKKQIDQPA